MIGDWGRKNYESNMAEDGELVIIYSETGSRWPISVSFEQIKHLIETPIYPTLQMRVKGGDTRNVMNLKKFELYAHTYATAGIKLPVVPIDLEKHPEYLSLLPSSEVFYCSQKRLYKQVYTVINCPYKNKRYLTDFEFIWPQDPTREQDY